MPHRNNHKEQGEIAAGLSDAPRSVYKLEWSVYGAQVRVTSDGLGPEN